MKPFTLNCGGRLLVAEKPFVMGILNLTPDSFYDGGKHQNDYLAGVEKMLNEGADIIDIGGMSSKPGSSFIDPAIELSRILPAIQAIKKEFDNIILSVDTVHSVVARECIENGVSIINDISGGEIDEKMIDIAAEYKIPYICMHMKGIPETMHLDPQYDNVVEEVISYLAQRIAFIRQKGVNDIIIDPGFGFGKKISHNFELLENLSCLKILDAPLMVGLSRKSMIWKTLGLEPETALNGTTVLHTVALMKGAQILRVHDVKEAVEVIGLLSKMRK